MGIVNQLARSLIIGAVLVVTAGAVWAQDGSGEFHLSRKNGYEVTVSIQVANGKVQKVSYSEWTPINRSAHECGMDAARDDGTTKWTERANVTTVSSEDDDSSTMTITTRADGLVVQSRCNNLKILFAWRAGKYLARIIQ